MATTPNGILGALIGPAGPVTGYLRNGRNILRQRHSRPDGIKTAARTAQRAKIKVCNDFLRAFKGTGFFAKTFPAYGHTGSGYNRATGALMNLAIAGSYPTITIAYPKVLISGGPLPPAANASAAADAGHDIVFSWTDNTGAGTAKANDKAVLVAYFPELQQVVFSFTSGVRSDGHAKLDTAVMQGYFAETWIGFLSNDERDAADSVYAGRADL